ncbi:MAG: ComEC/Rec2 family competence protein [Lachnospiraceae bacterium]|nr:ComEC/Rec2 family competence protein [Lachnospiraceae bacterium]
MKIKRPAILFLGATVLGIIIAVDMVSVLFKLILFAIAIFLYGKLFIEKKLYLKVLIVIVIFGLLGFFRFKLEEKIFDRNVSNVESLGKGNKIITGKVETIGKSTNSNYYILSNCFCNGLYLGKSRCYFQDDLKQDVKIGNQIKVTCGTSIIDSPSNEGEFDQKTYYRSSGITFISFANSIEVTNKDFNRLKQKIYEIKIIIKSQITKIFNEKDAGLFSAMVTGDKSTIDRIQKKRFSDNGIAHILAISGLHLSILGLALFELLRKKLSVNVSASLVSIFILLYGIFIDAGPASLRAITMLFIRFLSLAIGRTYDSKNTLFIIAFIFIIIRPYLLFNAGFQFSYIAIYALNEELAFMRITSKKIAVNDGNIHKENSIVGIKVNEIKIPGVILLNLFLFPITVYHYFTYPLYSIFVNLIVIPLMAFVLGFGLVGLGASFLSIQVGKMFSFVVHIIFIVYDKLCEIVEFLPSHLLVIGRPNLYEILYYFIVIFAILATINLSTKLIMREYKKYKNDFDLKSDEKLQIINKYKNYQRVRIALSVVALIISTLIISIRHHSDMRMTFVSVGQGDGIIIESKDFVISIDGGSSSNISNGQYILSPHIKSRAISDIDYVFITHADSDHTNGIIYLLESEDEVEINNLVLPVTATNDYKFDKLKTVAESRGTNILYMKEGDVKEFKEGYKIVVFNPNEESLKSEKRDENEMSLTFRLDYKNHSALFTGDIGKETIGRLLKDDFALEKIDVEVLKMPHHGSKNSDVPEFFTLASPKYSVFSYGKNNNYGHPSPATVDFMESIGSKVLKTGESGQIDIYFDKENITYRTYR